MCLPSAPIPPQMAGSTLPRCLCSREINSHSHPIQLVRSAIRPAGARQCNFLRGMDRQRSQTRRGASECQERQAHRAGWSVRLWGSLRTDSVYHPPYPPALGGALRPWAGGRSDSRPGEDVGGKPWGKREGGGDSGIVLEERRLRERLREREDDAARLRLGDPKQQGESGHGASLPVRGHCARAGTARLLWNTLFWAGKWPDSGGAASYPDRARPSEECGSRNSALPSWGRRGCGSRTSPRSRGDPRAGTPCPPPTWRSSRSRARAGQSAGGRRDRGGGVCPRV